MGRGQGCSGRRRPRRRACRASLPRSPPASWTAACCACSRATSSCCARERRCCRWAARSPCATPAPPAPPARPARGRPGQQHCLASPPRSFSETPAPCLALRSQTQGFTHVLDRGSLVAIEPRLRSAYARTMAQLTAPGARYLLIVVRSWRRGQHASQAMTAVWLTLCPWRCGHWPHRHSGEFLEVVPRSSVECDRFKIWRRPLSSHAKLHTESVGPVAAGGARAFQGRQARAALLPAGVRCTAPPPHRPVLSWGQPACPTISAP